MDNKLTPPVTSTGGVITGRRQIELILKAAPATPAKATKEPQPAEWAKEEAYQRMHKFPPNFKIGYAYVIGYVLYK